MHDPQSVRSMFARIAGRYDLLNRVLSCGIDQRWRRFCVKQVGDVRDQVVVDACCGTGDLSVAFERAGARVIGVDFTPEMLRFATPKVRDGRPTVFAHGDALRLPVATGSAVACTVAFGIRNVADRLAGMREMARVVRPGGKIFVLEFSTPPGWFMGGIYRTYFTKVLPLIGKWISGDGAAYRYLPETVLAWPKPDELQREMEDCGLEQCDHRLLTRGVACLHWGRVPGGGSA
jgi:demethylmenaquinone methyltransferase / 2-methoxy-6-polyprenyl-1,4-benzoquinol methylase